MSIFGALVDVVEDLRRQLFSGETKFTGKRLQRVFDANLTKLNMYLFKLMFYLYCFKFVFKLHLNRNNNLNYLVLLKALWKVVNPLWKVVNPL